MNEFFIDRQKCPCCASANSRELCRVPYGEDPVCGYLTSFYSVQGIVEFEYLQNQDYILVECLGCGLVYQREIPNEFLMKKLYEEWIDPQKVFDLYERSRGIDYFDRLSSEIVHVVRYFNIPPAGLTFLDYSMGWGHWCRIAQSFGCTVHGTEFSQARVDYARSRGVTVIDSAEVLNHQYDFINTEQVFEHLPDVRETLMDLKKSLKLGGMIKISVPDGWDIASRLERWDWSAPKGSSGSLNAVAPMEHINCFNRAALIRLAESSGLEPVDIPFPPRRSFGFLEDVKSYLRPLWHQVTGRQRISSKGGTWMFFRVSDPDQTPSISKGRE